ncbi:ACSBG1.2 family protein [Megaselia abdita]
MGFENIKVFWQGGAPTNEELKNFFLKLDINIFECYGLSETCGIFVSGPSLKNLKAIGKPFECELDIYSQNDDGEGEIRVRSRQRFMGYVDDFEATLSCISKDQWFKTGDIGRLTEDGLLEITGRKKEILITSGGENIPPYHIESLILSELPGLSNAIVVGNRRKYLTCLVSIKTHFDVETGRPVDDLLPQAVEWMRSLNLKYTKLSEIIKAGPCPVVMEDLQNGLHRVNLKALSNAQKVQKVAMLPHDFSVSTGELTSTLKIQRGLVEKIYEQLIDSLY